MTTSYDYTVPRAMIFQSEVRVVDKVSAISPDFALELTVHEKDRDTCGESCGRWTESAQRALTLFDPSAGSLRKGRSGGAYKEGNIKGTLRPSRPQPTDMWRLA